MIKSTRQLTYDSRNNRTAIIELEIKDWIYNSQNNSYDAVVVDYAITEEDSKIQINQKAVTYPADEIDQLFNLLNKSIQPNTDSFTEKLKDLIADSLLYVTVNDPNTIYGSSSEDWEKTTQ